MEIERRGIRRLLSYLITRGRGSGGGEREEAEEVKGAEEVGREG